MKSAFMYVGVVFLFVEWTVYFKTGLADEVSEELCERWCFQSCGNFFNFRDECERAHKFCGCINRISHKNPVVMLGISLGISALLIGICCCGACYFLKKSRARRRQRGAVIKPPPPTGISVQPLSPSTQHEPRALDLPPNFRGETHHSILSTAHPMPSQPPSMTSNKSDAIDQIKEVNYL